MIQTKYKPYPAYKKSGLDWIAEIPEGWEIRKVKYSAPSKNIKAKNGDFKIALENIESFSGKFIATETPFEGEGIEFDENTILYGKLRPYLCKVFLPKEKGICVSKFLVLAPDNKISEKQFLFYYLLSYLFTDVINGATFGSKMPRADWKIVGNFRLSLPLLPEQQAIAAFLDRETARINGIVEKQMRMIELLKEKRSAFITQMVTKGLDPKAKMKPSGVEWIGEIPEHWEVRKLKFCSRCNSDILPENTNPNYKIEYLDIGNVDSEGNILATENCYFTDAPSRARRIPKSTDTIISTVRTYLKAIAYLENIPKNFIVSTGFAVISGNSEILYAKYLYYFFCSHFFVESIMKESKGVSYPAINPTNLVWCPVNN